MKIFTPFSFSESLKRVFRPSSPLNARAFGIIDDTVVLYTYFDGSVAIEIDASLQEDSDLHCLESPLRSAVHRGKMAIMSVVADSGNTAPTHFDAKKYSGCADWDALQASARRHGLPIIHG